MRRFRRPTGIRGTFLGLLLVLTGQQALACEFSVGWEPWPPYQFKAEDGSVSGLDGDLINAIMTEMGCTIQWTPSTWKRQLAAVESGALDAAIGASVTEERQAWGHFTESYRSSANHLVVTTELNGRYPSLENFLAEGKRLGVMQDYHYGDAVMALLAGDAYTRQVQETLATEANMKKLTSGRVDGILMDVFVATQLKREMGAEDKIGADTVEVSSDTIHVLFSKASVSAEEVQRFNDVLARLQADGTLAEIIERYAR